MSKTYKRIRICASCGRKFDEHWRRSWVCRRCYFEAMPESLKTTCIECCRIMENRAGRWLCISCWNEVRREIAAFEKISVNPPDIPQSAEEIGSAGIPDGTGKHTCPVGKYA